jgi:hypothetical protein
MTSSLPISDEMKGFLEGLIEMHQEKPFRFIQVQALTEEGDTICSASGAASVVECLGMCELAKEAAYEFEEADDPGE